jgi:hypothetical protein
MNATTPAASTPAAGRRRRGIGTAGSFWIVPRSGRDAPRQNITTTTITK